MLDKIKIWFFKKIFEDSFLLGWANNHKTQISRLLQFSSGLAFLVGRIWPEYAYMAEVDMVAAFIASTIGVEVGKIHKEMKEKE